MARAIAEAGKLRIKAIVLTVDTVNNGNRERSYKNPDWLKSMADQCGGFAKVRTFEGAHLPPLLGHSARIVRTF